MLVFWHSENIFHLPALFQSVLRWQLLKSFGILQTLIRSYYRKGFYQINSWFWEEFHYTRYLWELFKMNKKPARPYKKLHSSRKIKSTQAVWTGLISRRCKFMWSGKILYLRKTGRKGSHPKCMYTNNEVMRGQRDGGNSHTFSGKSAQQGTLLKCYALISATWGTNRRN